MENFWRHGLVIIFAFLILQAGAMPARAFSGTKFTRPNWERSTFRRLDAEALYVVPATADGGDNRGEGGFKVC